MKRTPLKERILPTYTKGEERWNMISHIIGGGLGVVALLLCLWVCIQNRSGYGIFSSLVYGVSLIALYTMSSIYHGLRPGTGKKVMQVLDHCTIYFLIVGSYTPVALCAMRPAYPAAAWGLFLAVWGLAILAATLTAIDLKKYKTFSMVCYISMGWSIVVTLRPFLATVPIPGVILLLLGGIAYTIGAVLYGVGKKKRYMHTVFHFFVLLGSILQFFSIFFYVLR